MKPEHGNSPVGDAAATSDSIPQAYRLSTYDYELPEQLIAQSPAERREGSRLMAIRRGTGTVSHHSFSELPSLLKPSDVLVINETRVVPALLKGRKPSGGRVEILVLDPAGSPGESQPESPAVRTCMVRSSKPIREGTVVEIDGGGKATALERSSLGRVKMRFDSEEQDFLGFLQARGEPPLPPYIKQENRDATRDGERYQTVYGRIPGSVAAPTAGLHFSPQLLSELEEQGILLLRILLHVGPGTFTPVRDEDVRLHRMEPEYFEISDATADGLNRAISEGRRIISVGTTTVRTLESAAEGRRIKPCRKTTSLFIVPGYHFNIVDGLLTNFHLPRSTLLMLVCAFAGTETTLSAYREAVKRAYRFYSYGDACLILD